MSSLGLQESQSKASPPRTILTCLGVDINTKEFTLSVYSERLIDLKTLLHSWLTKKSATKRELQSLVGKLVFVSKCVRQSRVFIARMLCLLRRVALPHHRINLNAEFRRDIQWCSGARQFNGVTVINVSDWSSPGECFLRTPA